MKFQHLAQGLWVVMIVISGCGSRFNQPTASPTITLPPLASTATINPLPPTPLSDEAAFRSGVGITNPTAASLANNSSTSPDSTPSGIIRPQLVTVDAANGGLLNGEIYRPTTFVDGVRVPGILLLNLPLDDWSGLPVILRDSGFTVLVVEPRIPPVDGDFDAMIATLASDSTVNPERLAIGGGETAADLAFLACAENPQCDAVLLLTPMDREMLIANAVLFDQRAVLVIASSQDPIAAQTGEAVTRAMVGAATFFPFDKPRRGTHMLDNRPDLSGFITDWLRQTLR